VLQAEWMSVRTVRSGHSSIQPATRTPLKPSRTKSPTHNEPRTKRPMWLIQQHSRKLLMMAILMSETCWAHKKWNKMASDIKLVFYSSTITMMHGPINIRIFCEINLDQTVGIHNNNLGWKGLKLSHIKRSAPNGSIWLQFQLRYCIGNTWY